MQQPGGQTWNGGEQISNGELGTTAPPASDGPAYKEFDQTSTTTQHSISQLRSEAIKFDTKWVDKRVENRVAASCKKSLLLQQPRCTIIYCLAKITIA